MRRVVRVIFIIVLVLGVLLGILLGVNAWQTRPQGNPQATEFDRATISDTLASKRILAFGEATHGNHEFQQLRTELSRRLVDRGFTTIAFEADYAGTYEANLWINGQEGRVGNAEEAAAALGFRIYHTRETADWLAWLRAENDRRPTDQRIQLVGIDFQRIDSAKWLLETGLRLVDPALADQAGQLLGGYSTDWITGAGNDELATCTQNAQGLYDQFAARSDIDPGISHAARTIAQYCQTVAAGEGYARLRDGFMFDNLDWLLGNSGAAHVLLFAHSGHVDKTGSGFGFDPQMVSLGRRIAERWGEEYGVIGSDFHHTRVIADSKQGTTEMSVTNSSPLRGIFAGTSIGYLELATADEVNRGLLGSLQPVGNLGDQVSLPTALVPQLHSISLVPMEAYDALIFVEKATAVTPL